MRIRWSIILALTTVCLTVGAVARAEERFPPPDFESGYHTPATAYPPGRATFWEATDVVVLALALMVAAWLVLAKRSR